MPDAALDYGDPQGDPELRAELAAYLVRVRGVVAAPDELAVTSGYTQGLWLTCRALAARGATTGRGRGSRRSTTPGRTIRSAGLEVVGLPVDEHGVRLDALDADAVLVTPAHQFPTGAVLAPERRRALLAWGGIVIEDDYDSEYRYDRAPVGTLQRLAPDRVVYLGTASKTLAPALRLGWLRRAARAGRGDRARSAGRSTPAAPRSPRAPTPACWPPARSTATCGAPAATTASAATALVAALEERLPECRVDRRRRRPAPAPAAPARDGRGRRRATRWRSAGSGSAGSPATG